MPDSFSQPARLLIRCTTCGATPEEGRLHRCAVWTLPEPLRGIVRGENLTPLQLAGRECARCGRTLCAPGVYPHPAGTATDPDGRTHSLYIHPSPCPRDT